MQLDVDTDAHGNLDYCVQANCSLTRRGRGLWLCIIGINTLMFASAAALVGAWPVLPFAGIEILLVAFALHVIGAHDSDVEKFSGRGGRFEWQYHCGSRRMELVGNVAWARLYCRRAGGELSVSLSYAGRLVELGQGLSASQRQALAKTVRTVFIDSIA